MSSTLSNLDQVQGDQQWVKCQQATGTRFHLVSQFHEHKGVEVAYHATTTWIKHDTQGELAPRKHTSGYPRCFLHVRKEKVTACTECKPAERTTLNEKSEGLHRHPTSVNEKPHKNP